MWRMLLLELLLFAAWPCGAGEERSGAWACPERIRTDQKWSDFTAEWRVNRREVTQRLEFAELLMGPDAIGGADSIQSDTYRVAADVVVREWRLPPGNNYWIRCSYRFTDLVLMRRLEPKWTRCIMTVDPKYLLNGIAQIVSFECK